MALINVRLPDATEDSQMDDSELLKLEGGEDTEQYSTRWVQYHLKTNGALVHRSLAVEIKQVLGGGEAAQF